MHEGRGINARVIESFIAPIDFDIEEQIVTKGSWWMSVRINDEQAWQAVLDGTITGFSMGGMASAA